MKPYVKPAILRRENLASISREIVSGDIKHKASDARLKTDITRVGTTDAGLGLYTWRYHGQPEIWQGVIAQEVLKTRPEAVQTQANGFYAVDYGCLGVQMQRVN